MNDLRFLLTVISLAWAPSAAWAQGTRADYERADSLVRVFRGKVVRDTVEPHWLPGGTRFWYRVDLDNGAREFVLVDADAARRIPAFDHARLAEALGQALKKPVSANLLPFQAIAFGEADAIHFDAGGKSWRWDPKTSTLAEGKPIDPVPVTSPTQEKPRRRGQGFRRETAPDGKSSLVLKDHNLHLRRAGSEALVPLSRDGTAEEPYESGAWWSPDGTRLVALRTPKVEERKIPLIESSPKDSIHPKLHFLNYAKPGDPLPQSKPRLFDLMSLKAIPIKEDLFPTPWSISEMRWASDSSHFTFLYNQRGHQVLRLIAVDATSGVARAAIEETSSTFIDYAHKTYLQILDKGQEAVWMSERSGWNHLYRVDLTTGKVKNAITQGEWVVRSVDRVDEAKQQIWFRASGLYPRQDPYYIHFCRVNLDGTGLVKLTEGDGTHTVTPSPDGRFLLDHYSRVDMAPVTELRRAADGTLVCMVEKGDISALVKTGWRPPERFMALGRDGKTEIYGVICRPMNFDPSRKYPVIESIYAGPQGSFVPKSFQPLLRMQSLAELGFIVVQIDGMGTSNRSKAFHDVCCKNLGDSGFPDRILWLKEAARRDPSFDLTRVGIFGGSAGGQSALRALLAHGDFYKVAVSDCGCHDNRVDKVWWNELWMGWPIGPHYAEQSNVTQAHRLQGKLLLMVGEMDRNVDPASTLQVVNALIKANKDFDLLIFPGGGHGGGGAYAERRRRDFFVRNLLGKEPRSE